MSFTKFFSEIWRDFSTAGNPATPPHSIVKADMRAWGAEVEAALGGGGITNDLLADMVAARIKARITGTGPPEDATITQILDLITGASTRGSILYRGASAWSALAPGTNGQVLQSQGAGADPQWAAASGGLSLLNSGTVSNAATLDIVLTSFTAFRALKFVLTSFVPATDDVELRMRASSNGGSSYDAGASDYGYSVSGLFQNGSDAARVAEAAAHILIAGALAPSFAISNVAGEGGADAEITLYNQAAARFGRVRCDAGYASATLAGGGGAVAQRGSGYRAASTDVDAVRFLFESGNIASGNWALYGYA